MGVAYPPREEVVPLGGHRGRPRGQREDAEDDTDAASMSSRFSHLCTRASDAPVYPCRTAFRTLDASHVQSSTR